MIITIVLFIFLFFALGLLFVIGTACWGFWVTRVPYVRSNRTDTQRLLRSLSLRPGAFFYDLGSGDGRVLFMAESILSVRGVGFELTWWTYLHARAKKLIKKSSVEFIRKNFFSESWANADVVYCFLYPPLMRSVEEKFLHDCKPGTILVSRDFPLPTLRPQEIVDFTHPHNAYIYKK